jgi:two-component system KDP operon response regulator KdpE
MKILLVEDAPQVVESLTLTFQLQWADVEIVSTGQGGTAIDLVESEQPDLVLLDVGLPDIDGYRVLQAIREFSDLPVIMLTARDETMDKVKGLELGADDYITKPFDHLELLARMRSVLRRLDLPAPRSRIPSVRSADLEVDFQSQEARLAGTRLDLTPTEYKLLYHLVRNPGRVLTHETLLSRVWGREYTSELDYLRVYIRRLRDRLNDDPLRPVYIRTERGIGYRFLAPPPNATNGNAPPESREEHPAR